MKRQTKNADGSDRFTPLGRHWVEAPGGPVRTNPEHVWLVFKHERATELAEAIGPRPAAVLARSLEYHDAHPWPDRPPAPVRPEIKPFGELRQPSAGAVHRSAVRARLAARFDRKSYVPGV